MKTSRLIVSAALAALCLALAAPRAVSDAAAETPVRDYIRLHIVAHSDSAWDQGVKLAVRDAVRGEAACLLASCDTAEEAWRAVQENIDVLADAARRELAQWGASPDAWAEAGEYAFPLRRYGDTIVPAGSYRAVRVTLGEGEGHNWWCVLFPSLCLPVGTDDTAPVVFYSRLGRWLAGLLGRSAA